MNLAPILDQAVKALHDHHYDQVRDLLKDVPLSTSKTAPAPLRQEQLQLMRCHYIMGEVCLYDKNYSEAVRRLLEAYRYASGIDDRETAWRSRKLAGDALRELNQPGIALEHHIWCLNFFEEGGIQVTPDKDLQLFYSLALDYHALERYTEAINRYKRTTELAHQTRNHEYLANAYRGLATIYRNQDDLTFTRVYAYQAIGVCETLGDVDAIIRLKGGLARMLAKQGAHGEALHNAQEAFNLVEQANNLRNLLTAYVNLSSVTSQAGDHDTALAYAQKGLDELKRAEAESVKVNQITAGFMMAQVAQVLNRRGKKGDRSEIGKLMDKAFKYLQQSPLTYYLSSLYYTYAQILEDWGEMAEALKYIKKAVALGYYTKPPALEF
jgi:tetratricopeptide (TPR) repeat protein